MKGLGVEDPDNEEEDFEVGWLILQKYGFPVLTMADLESLKSKPQSDINESHDPINDYNNQDDLNMNVDDNI
eukprot:403374371